jgi:hypothetical protein
MSLALMSSVFCDAEGVLAQFGDWIEDTTARRRTRRSACPADYRAWASANGELTPPSV